MSPIPSRTVNWIAASLLVLFIPNSSRAIDSAPESDLVSRIASATAKEDARELQDLTAPGVSSTYTWVERGMALMGHPRRWQVKVLELPGHERSRFVAFTRYQLCESASDHLFPIVHTEDGSRLGEEIAETETRGYRVRDHKLSVRFEPKRQTALLSDRVTVERRNGAAPTAILRINAIYVIDSISSSGKPLAYKQAGGFVAVSFPNADRAVLDLSYHAKVEGSNEDYVLKDQAALTSYWYPHIGRLPATHGVSITVPKGWTAIGQGEPLAKQSHASSTTYTFSNHLAVCYFTVAAGKFTVTTAQIGGIPISAYLIHPNSTRAKSAIKTAGESIQWFARHFGPFPYKRYAVIESDPYPAALECYSFTLCGKPMIPLALVHEVAHTWWGGVVPNTYTRSLWNESFAEYSDGLYSRINHGEGVHEFNTQMAGMLTPLFKRVSLLKARDAMEPAQSAVGYGKGSLVLENLERMLGTEKMLACMKRFVQKHKPGEDAEWQDFIEAVAEVAGKEWAGYFPSWLERTDFPEYRLNAVRVEKVGERYAVVGSIAQGDSEFWSKIPVIITTDKGTKRASIDVRGRTIDFRIETSDKPTQIALDPNHEILRTAPKREGSGDVTVVKLELTQ